MTDNITYTGSCDTLPRYCRDRLYHILNQNRIELEKEKCKESRFEELDGDGVTLEDMARLRAN